MRITENQLRIVIRKLIREQAGEYDDAQGPSLRDRRMASRGPTTLSGDVGEWETEDDEEADYFENQNAAQTFGSGRCAECGVELIDGEDDTCEECKDVAMDWQPDALPEQPCSSCGGPLEDDVTRDMCHACEEAEASMSDIDDDTFDPDSQEAMGVTGWRKRTYGRYGTIADND